MLLYNGEIFSKDLVPLSPSIHDTLFLDKLLDGISKSGSEEYMLALKSLFASI